MLRKTLILTFLIYTLKVQAFPDSSLPKTAVTFTTSDTALQMLYNEAEKKATRNFKRMGKYLFLVEGGRYRHVWLETQPMGGYMYAKRDLVTARNNIQVFMDYQREDGRFPGMIRLYDKIDPSYGWLQGYCFPMPSFELYYWFNKNKEYLQQVYTSLEKFDNYLWRTRDSDNDGCLESWCIYDTGEDHNVRFNNFPNAWPFDYAPGREVLSKMSATEIKEYCQNNSFNPGTDLIVPIESMDIMSYSYSGRDVLSLIAKELNNGKEGYWRTKANDVRKKLKSYLWDAQKQACYDKDRSNKTMHILLHNNLRCMYFGSFDQEMADQFISAHLLNPQEFWTPMPLPSIAANDEMFRNISGNNWSGQPQGLTYQRSITALENYGHYAELTMIGTKLLKVLADSLKFPQQFEPFKATINSNSDGYGPSILSALEFISRLHGVHLTRDKIYWSCINSKHEYSYSQYWNNNIYKLTTKGELVKCLINEKEVFTFSKGARVVSDMNGKVIEVVGIDTVPHPISLSTIKKTHSMQVNSNTVYRTNASGKFVPYKTIIFKK